MDIYRVGNKEGTKKPPRLGGSFDSGIFRP
jgi:hypothetical protein